MYLALKMIYISFIIIKKMFIVSTVNTKSEILVSIAFNVQLTLQ